MTSQESRQGCLSVELQDLYDSTHVEYVATVNRLGYTDQQMRLAMLNEAAEDARERGNINLLLRICKQIAMDVGGMYVNARVTPRPSFNTAPIKAVPRLSTAETADVLNHSLEQEQRAEE